MLAENYTVSQPYACENLTIFLIHGEEKLPEVSLLTLQEALEQKKLIVHETRNVNELAIENLSFEEVYVQAGDIVKGGLQDRVFAYDVIVPAHSGKIPVGAFCVEQGRWRPRREKTGEVEFVRKRAAHSLISGPHPITVKRVHREPTSWQFSGKLTPSVRYQLQMVAARSAPDGGIKSWLIGDSPQMAKVAEDILIAAPDDITVLITGEPGTGKESAAHAIHHFSGRARGPFVVADCGAFPESLIESELFGYVKGAFTGAISDRKGLIEEANGGTIFLDEIGEAPLAAQVRLLRVLQERRIRPVGARLEKTVDVRVIAATNCDLERAVAEGRFRSDLYYRLNGFPIRMPALRERPSDIPLLVEHFLGSTHHRRRQRLLKQPLSRQSQIKPKPSTPVVAGIHPAAHAPDDSCNWPVAKPPRQRRPPALAPQ